MSNFLNDFIAHKDHLLFCNEEKYVFKAGAKASETNSAKIPSKWEGTLRTESVLKDFIKTKKKEFLDFPKLEKNKEVDE